MILSASRRFRRSRAGSLGRPSPKREPTSQTRGCQSMFTLDLFDRVLGAVDCCPWGATAGRHVHQSSPVRGRPLYTPEERRRRDASRWTIVQGILAPVQFVVFLASLGLVLRYLVTGQGWEIATASIILKTAVLYTIMVTGAIWE